MKTILIVEDEKMIRQGLAKIVSKSAVAVEEILECRNGMEAMEILKQKSVDVVFTDIRMPKMDGIQLVQEIDQLAVKPQVVVISGYDDFNYAVEMLKHGVADYLLKPIKREKIWEILEKLEKQYQENRQGEKDQSLLLEEQMKRLLLTDNEELEFKVLEKHFQKTFEQDPYAVILTQNCVDDLEGSKVLCAKNVGKQNVLFVPVHQIETVCQTFWYAGISRPHTTLRECRKAYAESLAARKEAFVQCKQSVFFTEAIPGSSAQKYDSFIEKYCAAFMVTDKDQYEKQLSNLVFEARHGKIEASTIIEVLERLMKKIQEMYCGMLPEEKRKTMQPLTVLEAANLEEFEVLRKEWMSRLSNLLSEQFSEDRNNRKIREAVQYIQDHYDEDLNMATVSNHVSMNYSLFSLSFKSYTGINFVNYLKEIRINAAKRLLEETDLRVQEIAVKVGYENDKTFMKIFKSVCGISPTEYRKSMELRK